jgi:hypothetical protein
VGLASVARRQVVCTTRQTDRQTYVQTAARASGERAVGRSVVRPHFQGGRRERERNGGGAVVCLFVRPSVRPFSAEKKQFQAIDIDVRQRAGRQQAAASVVEPKKCSSTQG